MEIRVKIKIRTLKTLKNGSYIINGNWYAKNQCELEYEDYAIVPKWLAELNNEKYQYLYNIPEKIEPKYNQEAINELRY